MRQGRQRYYRYVCEPGRVVGIAERSGDRIMVGVRFSAVVQTALGTHPASCTRDTGSFPGG